MPTNEPTNEPTQSKYDAALGKYNTRLDDAAIAAEVAALIAKKREEYNTPDVKKFLFSCIDLTTLRCEDNDESVMRFTQNVNRFDEEYPDLKNVAAICVYPNFAERRESDLAEQRGDLSGIGEICHEPD